MGIPAGSGGAGRIVSSSAPLNVLPVQAPTASAWTWNSSSRKGPGVRATATSDTVLAGSAKVPIPASASPATSAAVVSPVYAAATRRSAMTQDPGSTAAVAPCGSVRVTGVPPAETSGDGAGPPEAPATGPPPATAAPVDPGDAPPPGAQPAISTDATRSAATPPVRPVSRVVIRRPPDPCARQLPADPGQVVLNVTRRRAVATGAGIPRDGANLRGCSRLRGAMGDPELDGRPGVRLRRSALRPAAGPGQGRAAASTRAGRRCPSARRACRPRSARCRSRRPPPTCRSADGP